MTPAAPATKDRPQKSPIKVSTYGGLKVHRFFTKDEKHPFDVIEWEIRDAKIVGADGEVRFLQEGVEVPKFWTDTQTNIVAEKYFRVVDGVKEYSAKQMFSRVASFITKFGLSSDMFDEENAEIFEAELLHLLVNGMYAFNSPVWFNVGTVSEPQCSACFINTVEDNMSSIMDLAKKEVMLFKGGSGTGTNLSPLRSSHERLAGGGFSSGPVSFMEGFDSFAGITKSGGTTRRAAKMVILNVSHPDILEQKNGKPGFITSKSVAEKTAHDLYETGKYSAEWNKPGNIYELVGFQNANHSVRVGDDFMNAVMGGSTWNTVPLVDAKADTPSYKADFLFRELAGAAWECGDPGIQFHDATNRWNTCKFDGQIDASNPCSEYVFLGDTACNLGSVNLMKFVKSGKNKFDISGYRYACDIGLTAQELLVEASSYPSEDIEVNSHRYRALGLGYTNLGALLTYWGLPYDSGEGRTVAAAVTAIMGGTAYAQSAKMAKVKGSFSAYDRNKESMREVIAAHWDEAKRIPRPPNSSWNSLLDASYDAWKTAFDLGDKYGYRNAQVTVLAPTGTISFLMGADTTSIEPMLGCVVYKKVVGGGLLTLPNRIVEPSLRNLGYSEEQIVSIVDHVRTTGVLHTSPDFNDKRDGSIFAEALGDYALPPDAHVDMMAAVQPFLSGAISKTVNMPANCTVEDVEFIYKRAWKAGLKSVAVFRDGCKLSQPISTSLGERDKAINIKYGNKRRMPRERKGLTHKFKVGSQEGFIHTGFYPDGSLGEIFVEISKSGSTLKGLCDWAAVATSIAMQYGAPFDALYSKFVDMRFEPAGFTDNPDVKIAQSIPDYIFRYLRTVVDRQSAEQSKTIVKESVHLGDPCHKCGNLTKRSGSCFLCTSCGTTTGCS